MEESMSLMETLGWLGIIAIGFFCSSGNYRNYNNTKINHERHFE